MTRRAEMKDPNTSAVTRDELATLWKQHGPGLSPTQLRQSRVPLSSLVVAPKVFALRQETERPWQQREHVAALVETVRRSGDLNRLDVFAVAGVAYLVDGHARVAAYRQVYPKGDRRVPVRFLQGTFDDALRRSVRANTHARLPLTLAQRLEAAWRLVTHNATEHAFLPFEIPRDTGVSPATVRRMTDALKQDPTRALSWAEVERTLIEPDEAHAEDDLAARWANLLRTEFDEGPSVQPAAFLIAMDEAYPDLRERRYALECGEFVRWMQTQGYTCVAPDAPVTKN